MLPDVKAEERPAKRTKAGAAAAWKSKGDIGDAAEADNLPTALPFASRARDAPGPVPHPDPQVQSALVMAAPVVRRTYRRDVVSRHHHTEVQRCTGMHAELPSRDNSVFEQSSNAEVLGMRSGCEAAMLALQLLQLIAMYL